MTNDVYNPFSKILERLEKIENALNERRNDKLIPAKHVAKMLDITPETLVRWQNGGHIRPTYISKRKYFAQSEIERIISENTAK